MLHMAMHTDLPLKFIISIKFKLQIQFVKFRRGHPGTPIDPAPVLLAPAVNRQPGFRRKMLGPAANRQPGFRRRTRRAEQRREEQRC